LDTVCKVRGLGLSWPTWTGPIPTHLSAIEKYFQFGHFGYKPKISTGKSMAGIGFYNGKFEKSQKKCHFHRQTCFFLHGIQTLVCID